MVRGGTLRRLAGAAVDDRRRLQLNGFIERSASALRAAFTNPGAIVRAQELGLVALAAIVGVIAGVVAAGMWFAAQTLHRWLYGIDPGRLLSAMVHPLAAPQALFLAAGGLLVGLLTVWQLRRRGGRSPIDPIEANALHGGRMGLADSLIVGIQNILSSGCGASVGLEAGYTQVSGAIASWLGRHLKVRRGDLRTLVGCGAGAAIGAAFDAPLAGAFYAFELIIGTYSIATVAPVVLSALVANGVARWLRGPEAAFHLGPTVALHASDYTLFLVLAVCIGLAAIVLMYGLTMVERLLRALSIPQALRPAVGGLLVGLMALISPQVLSSGHGALELDVTLAMPATQILALLLMKALASAISIGAGFRGGMFSASLLLGALAGRLFADLLGVVAPGLEIDPASYAIVGMGCMAVAVIGGPLTMAFLTLEMTGDAALSMGLVAAVIVSAVTVRELFGYSFATWRFHLRGETIRSAHDVGWIRDLTVDRLMRPAPPTVSADIDLATFCRDYPLGSATAVVAVDAAERYAGMIPVVEAHHALFDATTAGDVSAITPVHVLDPLLPSMNAQEAMALFDRLQVDMLAVVDGPETRRVVGTIAEAYLLRRYAEEVERSRREAVGEL